MTQLQRNPKLISQASQEVQILDKRKNQVIGVFVPTQKSKDSITLLAGIFAGYTSTLPSKTKGMTEDEKINWAVGEGVLDSINSEDHD